jgi:WD40 repeat protein
VTSAAAALHSPSKRTVSHSSPERSYDIVRFPDAVIKELRTILRASFSAVATPGSGCVTSATAAIVPHFHSKIHLKPAGCAHRETPRAFLCAVGSGDTRVRLCDVSSGGFAHSLAGHRDAVWAVTWSLTSEYVLMTGGCDGAIRFWDIRR